MNINFEKNERKEKENNGENTTLSGELCLQMMPPCCMRFVTLLTERSSAT
jgi:hypothetical protein